MSKSGSRKPIALDPNDPAILLDQAPEPIAEPREDRQSSANTRPGEATKTRKRKSKTDTPMPDVTIMEDPETSARQRPAALEMASRPATRWGAILISALGALVSFAAGIAITDMVENLFARADWLGWAALGIAAIAGFAMVMICAREFIALLRLRRINRLREDAARAIRDNDTATAKGVLRALKSLYSKRPDCAWGLAQMKDAESLVFDADDQLKIAERELMKNLDARAAQEIARAVRRVSLVTAISPIALLDMGFVLVTNLSMLRKLAALYGGRPGAIGLFRLARMVIAHLTITGGVAVGDGLLQQIFGHGLAAKLSARLGSGVLNGLFTARIGLAALDICRPMPFHNLSAPTIKALMSEVAIPTK